MRTVLSDQEIIDLGLVDIDTTDQIAMVEWPNDIDFGL